MQIQNKDTVLFLMGKLTMHKNRIEKYDENDLVLQHNTSNENYTNLEFIMKSFNVIFNSLNELCLVLSDCPTNSRSNKQSIEPGKDPEHLICILCSTKLVTQSGSDSCLNSINLLIIPLKLQQNESKYKQKIKND